MFLLNTPRARKVWQKKFGDNVRRERVARKLTQEKLAEMSNLSISGIQNIESAKTGTLGSTVSRIQKALKCSWEKLMP